MRLTVLAAAAALLFAGTATGDTPHVVCHESAAVANTATWGIGSAITCEGGQ